MTTALLIGLVWLGLALAVGLLVGRVVRAADLAQDVDLMVAEVEDHLRGAAASPPAI